VAARCLAQLTEREDLQSKMIKSGLLKKLALILKAPPHPTGPRHADETVADETVAGGAGPQAALVAGERYGDAALGGSVLCQCAPGAPS
jgi:hypothetical protein